MSTVAESWLFESGSSSRTYETLRYTDRSTSCNCPGWTRRTTADGSRSCKHTRLVEAGLAHREAKDHRDYGPSNHAATIISQTLAPIPAFHTPPPAPPTPKPTLILTPRRRVS